MPVNTPAFRSSKGSGRVTLKNESFYPVPVGGYDKVATMPFDDDEYDSDDYSDSDSEYSDDDDSSWSSSDSESSDWDDDLDDELMTWVNSTAFSDVGSTMMMNNLLATPVTRMKTHSGPLAASFHTLLTSIPDTTIADRMRKCQAQFFQNPELESKKTTVVSKTKQSSKPEKPEEYLKQMFAEIGVDSASFCPRDDEFLAVTDEHVSAHSLELTTAARNGDLRMIKEYHRQGRTLQTCNRHGESILHIICRRARIPALKYMLDEAGVSIMIRDDVGRTPMHDAAWTHNPNFELVEILLEKCPRLIFAYDTRRHSPLSYVPKEKWGAWCEFLESKKSILMSAMELHS